MVASAHNARLVLSIGALLAGLCACGGPQAQMQAAAKARARDLRAIDAYVAAASATARRDRILAKRTLAINADLPPGALALGTNISRPGASRTAIADVNVIAADNVPIWGYVYRLTDGTLAVAPRGRAPMPLTDFETQLPNDAVVSPVGDAMGRPLGGSAQLLPVRPHENEERSAAAASRETAR